MWVNDKQDPLIKLRSNKKRISAVTVRAKNCYALILCCYSSIFSFRLIAPDALLSWVKSIKVGL